MNDTIVPFRGEGEYNKYIDENWIYVPTLIPTSLFILEIRQDILIKDAETIKFYNFINGEVYKYVADDMNFTKWEELKEREKVTEFDDYKPLQSYDKSRYIGRIIDNLFFINFQ